MVLFYYICKKLSNTNMTVIIRFILISIIFGFCSNYHSFAQQIKVLNFKKSKEKLVQKDKQNATVIFETTEEGFEVLYKGEKVKSNNVEGKLIATLPHKSTYFSIKHPNYGKIDYKLPIKHLEKAKVYGAMIVSNATDKEFKIQKQWLKLDINPQNAIVFINDTIVKTKNGKIQLLLGLGVQHFKILSPFYEPFIDSVEICENKKIEQKINLRPIYSYIEINCKTPNSKIYLNNKYIGSHTARTNKLIAGSYSLRVESTNYATHYSQINIGKNEKKSLDIELDYKAGFVPSNNPTTQNNNISKADSTNVELTENTVKTNTISDIKITTNDTKTEILINRENVGTGLWKGNLENGIYALQSRKNDLESTPIYLVVDNQKDITLNLDSPSASYGSLNIDCNVTDAEIIINRTHIGKTPLIIQNLPTNTSYYITIQKQGYKQESKEIKLINNDILNIKINLKKK